MEIGLTKNRLLRGAYLCMGIVTILPLYREENTILLAVVQLLTLLTATLLFGKIMEEPMAVLFGTLFYLTCPYRVALLYGENNIRGLLIWMILPLFLFAWKWAEKWKVWGKIGVLMLGALCLVPFFYHLSKEEVVLQSIMSKGYFPGEVFSPWVSASGKPGIGLALLTALLLTVWYSWISDGIGYQRKYRFYTLGAGLMLLCSMWCFPWDYVQRLGTPFLRLVSRMETPAVCFGFASMFLCVPAAYGMGCVGKCKSQWIGKGAPVVVFGLALLLSAPW